MSDLLNSASLVMIPSGYKEDTVYSVVPSDGSGDLSFTRASNGTRVNSAGLVEVCPWNFVEQSSNLGSWPNDNVTITTGITDAFGTTNAVTMSNISSGNNTDYIAEFSNPMDLPSGTVINTSVYLKGSGTIGVAIERGNTGDYFFTSQIFTLTNAWVRYDFAYTMPSGTRNGIHFYVTNLSGTTATSVDICFPQINYGLTAKPYFPTTDRLNVPRLTYQNGGGGCPSLLLEKQSTNYVFPSEDFSTTWSLYNSATVTTNQATSPDGTQNADKLTTANSANALYNVNDAGSSSGNYTASIFVKPINNNSIGLGMTDDTTGEAYVLVDVTTGVGTTASQTSNWTSVSYTWEQQANGWYRISLTATKGATGNARFILKGNASSEYYIYGAQLEASSYPTSYIPTTSSSATRVADLASVNLPNTNMTFTAYLELDEASLGTPAGDWFSIFSNVSALGRAYGYANQFGFADAYSLGVTSGTKMVWKQESGSTAKIFKGGALVGTSTTGTYTDPFNRFRMDGALLDKPVKIKQFVYFDNALTDAECIQLTA